MDFFKVLHDNTSTIDDLSLPVKDYTTSAISAEVANTHYLYVGYYKPFKQFYIELGTANTEANELSFEYWNGTAWTALEVIDESEGWTKSGFSYFIMPEDWAENTVDSIDNFYIRLQPSVSHSVGTTIQGLGVLFSNDLDLEGIKSNIVTKLNSGNSWIEKHEAAKKYIIQKLRNLGHRKFNKGLSSNPAFTGTSINFLDLNEFDLLEPFELREASKFYALSFIYLDELSDEQDDKWERAGRRHEKRADEAINLFMLKVDVDDDGEENTTESNGTTRANLSWA